MVFANYLKQKWEAEAIERATNQRHRNMGQMMEWAKERGIPLDELPESGITSSEFGNGYRSGYDKGYTHGVQEGMNLERQRLGKTIIQAWARERNIPFEELPDIFR